MIACIILTIIVAIAVVCEFYALKTGVPTVDSFPSARKKIVDILQKHIGTNLSGRDLTIVDLGSGGGQLCAHLAKEFPQARVIGIEISLMPWLRAKLTQKIWPLKNIEFKRIDFWSYDCADIDVVVLFLTSNILERLGHKLRHELKPGALILANDEPLLAGWKSVDIQPTGFLNSQIYVYQQSNPSGGDING